jgi:hypothetical protein
VERVQSQKVKQNKDLGDEKVNGLIKSLNKKVNL